MTVDAFLTVDELERLTGKRRPSAQARVLVAKGIPFRRAGINEDGEPLVRWSDLDAKGKPAQRRGHRWDRIGGVRQLRT